MGNTYVGNSSGVAKVPKKIYAGNSSNVAKAVKVVYCGNSSGKAVEVWRNSTLPSTYQKVEYIFNTGGKQYINTGILANSDTKVMLECEFSNISHLSANFFFGALYQMLQDERSLAMNIQNGEAKVNVYFAAQVLKNNNSVSNNTRYIFRLNESGGNFYKNNDLLGTSTSTFPKPSENNMTLLLFGLISKYRGESANTYIAPEGLRVYHFQAWQSGVIVRDMYPCYLKSNTQTVGMYDLANGQFYGNSGTGIFYKGPDID